MIKDKYSIAVLKDLSSELDISVEELEKVHDSAFKFIVVTVPELKFSEMNEDEFDNAKKSFNIPSLGKFYPKKNRFLKINKLDK